jgi:hypothetical protein
MKTGKFIIAFTVVLCFAFVLAGAQKIEEEKILQTTAEWQENYDTYRYNPTYMETLKTKIGDNLKIDIYLGLWCSDSRNNVPGFMKILDALDQNNLTVNYYTVERKANKEVKYFVEDLKVERVPTFIFYRDGKEIGRIVENPNKTLIEDFLDIVF